MRFRVERDVLAEAVAWTARSLPVRPPVAVLAGLLLEADDNGLALSGFDYEVSARAEVSADISRRAGACSSPAVCWPTSASACRPSRSTSASTAPRSR